MRLNRKTIVRRGDYLVTLQTLNSLAMDYTQSHVEINRVYAPISRGTMAPEIHAAIPASKITAFKPSFNPLSR